MSKNRPGLGTRFPGKWPESLRHRSYSSDTDFLPESVMHPKLTHRKYGRSSTRSTASTPDPVFEIRPPPQLVAQSFIQAREQAIHTLEMCRSILLSLEMTRMCKARTGARNWMLFWHRIYYPELARALCGEVNQMFPKIDTTFRTSAKSLCNLTYTVSRCIKAATTEAEIVNILEEMERTTIERREIRRECVLDLLDCLRVRIEDIPVEVSDELFDDMKRGVFALDARGDYHPGDADAEARDRQIGQPLEAGDYVRADPQLPWRPGFREEFREAITRATMPPNQENIPPSPEESTDEWVNSDEDPDGELWGEE
jgi:hypothetical protein